MDTCPFVGLMPIIPDKIGTKWHRCLIAFNQGSIVRKERASYRKKGGSTRAVDAAAVIRRLRKWEPTLSLPGI